MGFFEKNKELAQNQKFGSEICEVLIDTGNSAVIVESLGEPGSPFTAQVLTTNVGTIITPDVGSLVMVMYSLSGTAYVIGVVYGPEDNIPNHGKDEKIIGLPDSNTQIILRPNGETEINGDFTIIPHHPGDPDESRLTEGAMWYNSTEQEYRGYDGTNIVNITSSVVP